ncbi:MAG: AAA family ATPase [Chloroflexi bacterium]|nr:AAA family ATPase [Chloroflexota bacterium]
MNHSTSDKSLGYGFLFIPPIMPEVGQARNLYITFKTPSEGGLYFTMEWIEGQDLEPHGRRMDIETSVPIVVQVCRALAYLHSRGVIHGDLKLANVLMSDDASGQVKIVDFGIALEMRSPEARARYYSPGYSAPEMKKPQPIDHRADLYSLGALWYTLLLGEPPIFMFGAERMVRMALNEVLAGQDGANIGDVIAQLLATAPEERYASANEVIEAINQATGSTYQLETRETASSYALRTHFVNREAEVEVLEALWEQARSDEGKLVLVSGGSGVGKSRLVREQEVQAELQGAWVVWGQCVESGNSAYHPWREVLRVLVRYIEAADKEAMLQAGPVLATILPELWDRDYMAELPLPVEIEPQAAKLRLNQAIVRVMRAAASLRPAMIVVENVQWADEATLELLSLLARIPIPRGLLVYATYRSDEIGIENPLLSLSGDHVYRIPLQPLSSEVTADLVRSMLGLEQVPPLLMERVQRTTGGNAFFVQELIRSLAVEGNVLQRTVEGWQVDGQALREIELPKSIRQVMDRRLLQLSADARETLAWAAVMGLGFWEGSVAEVGHVAQAQIRAALRDLVNQGLVIVRDETAFTGEQEYLFLNPTVREAGYASIPRETRPECHRRVAAWLLSHSALEVNQHLALLAEHLERSEQMEQAAIYWRRAGEQAAQRFANADAVRYLSRALDLMPEDKPGCYDILLIREKVYGLQGAREKQEQDLTRLGELAQMLDDDHRRIEVALRRISYAEAIGDYPAAVDNARQAIALARGAGDVESEATAYLRWGRAIWRHGDLNAAQAPLDQALVLARAAGLRQIEAGVLRDLGDVAYTQESDIAGGKRYGEQSLHICRELGDRQGEGEALNLLGTLCRTGGDITGARECYEQTLCVAQEIGDRRYEGFAIGNLGMLAGEGGDYTQAVLYNEQALRIMQEIGDRRYEGFGIEQRGILARIQGDHVRARACFEQALAVGREIDSFVLKATGASHLSVLCRDRGDSQAALAYAQQAVQSAQKSDMLFLLGTAWVTLGYALEGLGRLEEAAEAYRQAVPILGESSMFDLVVGSLVGLARVFLVQNDLAQAQTQVEEILKRLEAKPPDRMQEPFLICLSCYRVLRANQDPRAREILNTAHRLLQERAAKIDDETMRRSFLENVAAHHEIVDEWTNRQGNV